MNNPRHLIDIEAGTPIEFALDAALQQAGIAFEVQPSLFGTRLTYLIVNLVDLQDARNVLYHVLHTPKAKEATK